MPGLIKTPTEIQAMRESGAILAGILRLLTENASPGVTPKQLSDMAVIELKSNGAEPVFLNYKGYPDVICISVNDQVQHAIPSSTPLKKGDVVNFDFGVRIRGMITDAGTTFIVGGMPLNKDDARLLNGTQLARDTAIEHIRAGVRVGDISAIIEMVLKNHKLGIVKELVGHGVGHQLHEDPEIPNYGKAGTGMVLKAGMTIAIEPITTLGSPDIYVEKDGWTIRTWDGTNSAQFEHTVLVLENGCEILTEL